jgi:hypothetical protein
VVTTTRLLLAAIIPDSRRGPPLSERATDARDEMGYSLAGEGSGPDGAGSPS